MVKSRCKTCVISSGIAILGCSLKDAKFYKFFFRRNLMVLETVAVNYLTVLVAAVTSIIISGLWYSPLLFGNLWVHLSGIDMKKVNAMKKESKVGRSYFWAFVMTLITCYVLAHFVAYVDATTFGGGAVLAFWVWLGFMVPLSLNDVLWGGKSFKLFLLNAAHHLIALIVAAGILAVWW